jgi:hypothetical protein
LLLPLLLFSCPTDTLVVAGTTQLMGASADYYRGLWEVVRPTTKFAIEKFGLLSFPSFSRKQQVQLQHIMTSEVEEMLDRVHTTLQL